jgi:hypothetical protein
MSSTPVKHSSYQKLATPYDHDASCTPIKKDDLDNYIESPSTSFAEDDCDTSYLPSNLSLMEAVAEESMDVTVDEVAGNEDGDDGNEYVQEKKYIVFHSQLFDLFSCCPVCGGASTASVFKKVGSLIIVKWVCQEDSCSFQRMWHSQPHVRRMPAGNLLLSAAILMTGSLPTQALRMLNVINIATMSLPVFFKHQRQYLIPVIIAAWKEHQEKLIAALNAVYDGKIVLSGDGRSDSPGHCAKYGTFTVIEQQINKVLDVQQVQVNIYPLPSI